MNAYTSVSRVNSMIEWNTEELRSDLIAKSEHHMMYTNCKFGILRIEVPILPISTQPLAILLNLDHSGSMDDSCADGRTKMQHIKHTIKNILRVLMIKIEENPELELFMCIDIFSHDVENILQKYIKENPTCEPLLNGFIRITKESSKWIIKEVDNIVPWGCTNIELSLKHSQETIRTFQQNNPDFRIAHIQLTDGQATMGKSTPEDLKSRVDTSYRNIFVGYGEDHDGYLMASLGELSPMCEYKFVDIIENTGLVYGEILYNLLYPLYDSVVYLNVLEGAKIYDWRTNTWVQELSIPPLSGNSEKIFQIIADGSVPTDEIFVNMYRMSKVSDPIEIDKRLFETAMSLPQLICAETGKGGDTLQPIFKPNDLTLFLLRQLTQEHLYMVREFENERVSGNSNRTLQKPILRRQTAYVDMDDDIIHTNIPPELEIKHRHLKNALLEHFYELSVYYESFTKDDDDADDDDSDDDLKTNSKKIRLQNITFLKVLMDDMHIAIKNMGTEHGLMYTAARQTSQGRQSSYVPTGQSAQKPSVTHFCKSKQRTMNTFDLYGQKDDQETYDYNLSGNTNTSYANDDVMSMMTQIQGFETDNMYLSENIQVESDDEDMTQVQVFETDDMYLSDVESENTQFEYIVEGIMPSDNVEGDQENIDLPGEHLLRPDIGYDQNDVFNPDYYFDKLPIAYNDDEIEIIYTDKIANDLNEYLCYKHK